MPLPKCIDCKSYKLERIPDQQTRQILHLHVCQHAECAHPVTGTGVPAEQARQMERMCGWDAKYFEKREDEAPATSNVIKLET